MPMTCSLYHSSHSWLFNPQIFHCLDSFPTRIFVELFPLWLFQNLIKDSVHWFLIFSLSALYLAYITWFIISVSYCFPKLSCPSGILLYLCDKTLILDELYHLYFWCLISSTSVLPNKLHNTEDLDHCKFMIIEYSS